MPQEVEYSRILGLRQPTEEKNANKAEAVIFSAKNKAQQDQQRNS